jgi:hypothetical protein
MLWNVKESGDNASGISILSCNHIYDDAVMDVIVGKDDGTVEIHSFEPNNPNPFLKY